MKNLFRINILGANEVPDVGPFTTTLQKVSEFIFGIVLPIVFWLLAAYFTFLAVKTGTSIASAGTPEEKKKAIDRLIWLIVGIVITFVMGFLISPLVTYLGRVFGII